MEKQNTLTAEEVGQANVDTRTDRRKLSEARCAFAAAEWICGLPYERCFGENDTLHVLWMKFESDTSHFCTQMPAEFKNPVTAEQ